MRKFIVFCILFVAINQYTQAQIHFGFKTGVNYNYDTFSDVSSDVLDGAKSRAGFHTGFWFIAKLPVVGLYLRPEIVYTELKNKVSYDSQFVSPRSTNFKFRKIDVPFLIGKKFLGIGTIFGGPSFQYIFSSDFNLNDLKEVSSNNFSLGIQLGAGIELGRLGLDLRWERGFSKIESYFVDNTINSNFNFDTRVNQIIFGISYKLNKTKKDK
tara:strand:+ start:88341 stop:88976 length:636 start_codon:yes stop_codon:yes gene_type:complete